MHLRVYRQQPVLCLGLSGRCRRKFDRSSNPSRRNRWVLRPQRHPLSGQRRRCTCNVSTYAPRIRQCDRHSHSGRSLVWLAGLHIRRNDRRLAGRPDLMLVLAPWPSRYGISYRFRIVTCHPIQPIAQFELQCIIRTRRQQA